MECTMEIVTECIIRMETQNYNYILISNGKDPAVTTYISSSINIYSYHECVPSGFI